MRSLAARFGLIALAGCPQTSPPPAPELTAKQVFVRSCELYADAWCARRDRCAVSTDRATQGEACLQAAKRGCQAKTAVALDRAFDTFETSLASECIAAVASVECAATEQWLVDLAVCRMAFGAQQARGGGCLTDGDCIEGYCAREREGCGQCEPRGAPADSCDEFPCAEGAVCVRDVCRPRRSEGQACEQDVECGPGLFCHLERRVCEAQRGVDAPCADDRDIVDCAETLFCADRVCTEQIDRRTGSPCEAQGSVCEVGNWCDGSFCRAFLEVGADCAEDRSCGPLGACVNLQCVDRGDLDAACSRDRHCLQGMACFEGRCRLAESCP